MAPPNEKKENNNHIISEDVIYTSNGDTYELKSDHMTGSQMEYITDYLEICWIAVKSSNIDNVNMYMDIPSMIDSYIVEELFKNLDVGWGSFYFTKPKGVSYILDRFGILIYALETRKMIGIIQSLKAINIHMLEIRPSNMRCNNQVGSLR